MKGYFRDPGFGENTVRDSGKRKISWRETGFCKGKGEERKTPAAFLFPNTLRVPLRRTELWETTGNESEAKWKSCTWRPLHRGQMSDTLFALLSGMSWFICSGSIRKDAYLIVKVTIFSFLKVTIFWAVQFYWTLTDENDNGSIVSLQTGKLPSFSCTPSLTQCYH